MIGGGWLHELELVGGGRLGGLGLAHGDGWFEGLELIRGGRWLGGWNLSGGGGLRGDQTNA